MKRPIMRRQVKILGIAGSTLGASYNRAALRAARNLAPDGVTLDVFDLDGIQIWHYGRRLPASIIELKKRVREADGILFVTLEYNNSIPKVLEDAINWAAGPRGDNVWNGKPAALMGATISGSGKAHELNRLRDLAESLNMRPLNGPELIIERAADRFDTAGNLTDGESRNAIRRLLKKLAEQAIDANSVGQRLPIHLAEATALAG